MIFCARATRGLRRPSLGLLTRLGVPVGGRVRKLRAVEDPSTPIPGGEAGQEVRHLQLLDDFAHCFVRPDPCFVDGAGPVIEP